MSERDTKVSVINSAGAPPSSDGKAVWRRSARGSIGTGALRSFAVALVSIAAAIAPAAPAAAASSPVAQAHAAPFSAAVCGPAAPGYARCLSLVRTDIAAVPSSQVAPLAAPSGYGPSGLQSAYNLARPQQRVRAARWRSSTPTTTRPPSPTSGVYRSQYGLPACTTANGCFRRSTRAAAPATRGRTAVGRGDLARPRHGVGDLPALPHPPGRGELRVLRQPGTAVNRRGRRSARSRSPTATAAATPRATAPRRRLLQPPRRRDHRQLR